MHNIKKELPKLRAFSLLELSIVIVIIGLLLIGVFGAKHLIKKSRISTAHNLTSTSPINGIQDNALWLESSLDDLAFADNPNASNGDNLDSWKDNSYNQNKVTVTKAGSGPTYANTINDIQAVQFAGSSSDYLTIENASFLNNTDYTIFVLEKRESDSSDNYFIGDSEVTTANETLLLGYSTDTAPIHSQGTGNNYTANLESYSSYFGKPRLFTFISDSTNGKKMYINGVLAAQDSDTTQLSNISTLPIGKGYNGEIGEIAIFTRALKTTEIRDVEDYLGKKWNNKINRDQVSSCLNGTITSSGCDSSCAFSVNGVSTTSLANGSTASFTCGTGYTGSTPSYTCTDGVFDTDPDAADCQINGCDTGYVESGDSCVQGCNTSAIVGTSISSVAAGSTAVSCNATGYTGSFTFSGGACSAGDTLTGSCTSCDAGYNLHNSVCEAKCTLSDPGVGSDVLVDSGSTSYDCSDSGSYSGTVSYDVCNNGDALTSVTGSCLASGSSDPFVSTWDTSSGSVTLPLISSGTYNFTVDWGDGSNDVVTAWDDAEKSHTYSSPGSHTISISGTIQGWSFNNNSEASKITEISQWGVLRFGTSADNAFYGCSNLTITATDIMDTTHTSMASFFKGCSSITNIPSINSWDLTNVTNLSGFCDGCTNFDQDLSGWDWTAITDATNFLNGVTLSTSNYNALLNDIASQSVQTSVSFNGGNSIYSGWSASGTAHTKLRNEFSWSITDGGADINENATLWLDAYDEETITTATGVSQWNDKSGGGHNVAQSNSSRQPGTGSVTQNGKNVVTFNGSNQALYISGVSLSTQPTTIFVVAKTNSFGSSGRQYVFDGVGSDGARQLLALEYGSSDKSAIWAGSWLINSSSTGASYAVYTLTYNGASSSISVGGSTTSGSSGNGARGLTNGIRIGASYADNVDFLNGVVAELIIVNGSLSGSEISDIEGYLSDKWGI